MHSPSLAAPPSPLGAGAARPVGGSKPSLVTRLRQAPENSWLADADSARPGSLLPEALIPDCGSFSICKVEGGAGGILVEDGAPLMIPAPKFLILWFFSLQPSSSSPSPLSCSLYNCMCPNTLPTNSRLFSCRPDVLNRWLARTFTAGLPVSSCLSFRGPPCPFPTHPPLTLYRYRVLARVDTLTPSRAVQGLLRDYSCLYIT